jgi:hypothetical protein
MFYQGSKTAKAAVIGTIMPWTGPLGAIPDGWVICDGSTKNARDYPLLVQAIGDTYNAGVSNLGGSFPNYSGEFVLPDLNNRMLLDIEEDYFGSVNTGGTGKSIDTDVDARSIISPFIGDNVDNGIPVVYNNVYTDVIFTLNDRTGYSGRIKGNTIIPGEFEKTIYLGGRKLGTSHIRSHSHSGSYETLANSDPTRPGEGVVPYENATTTFKIGAQDTFGDSNPLVDNGNKIYFTYNLSPANWGAVENVSGFGSGIPGRTVARVRTEIPPVNLTPQRVMFTPIKDNLDSPTLDSGTTIPYALGGNTLTVPVGLRNYYPDIPGVGNFGTLVSNRADNWDSEFLLAHNHDPIDVQFDTASLKPSSSLVGSASIPATTVLDNGTNVAAFQIDMNTTQPSLTCVYIIRAY